MQTWRLTVGPDGQIRIPDTKPGQEVMVQVVLRPTDESEELTLATARTPEEVDAVISQIEENARKLRELAKDRPPFSEDDLYGADGLPG